jgi:hypothetical protein
MRSLIAFTGRAGAGKSEQCQILQKEGYKKVSFATPLRKIIASTLGYTFLDFMENYEKLKRTEIFNKQTLRNMMEGLGSKIRYYDENFFVKCLIKELQEYNLDYVCIDDLRYKNEYYGIKDYCDKNKIDFKLIFCNYQSERYQAVNEHESAWMSNRLCELGYKDLQELKEEDIQRC